MYSTSATFQTKIKDRIRQFRWSGTINTATPISFTDDNVITGELVRSISGEALEIGTVYASQLTMEMDLPSVSRYELYGVEIELNCQLVGASDIIPMGVFTITEALQQASKITITAYDAMIKFDDVKFNAADNNAIQTPFTWLSEMCAACGVTLGTTSAEIDLMPNGNRKTGFADVVSDADTWRDVLGYIAAFLGGYSYIGRDGELYIGAYGSTAVDTVPANFRMSSNLSDFRTTYDGLYAIYKNEGLQEYVSNTNTGGIVLNIGTNPFLQISNATNREEALQEIIDAWDGIYYVPYSSEMPLVPTYDPGDVLEFTGNQADVYDYGAITEITYTIGGNMTVVCSGDNPRLAEAQDRFTKTIAGLSKEYSNGQEIGDKNFWLLFTTNNAVISVDNTEIEIAEIEYDQKTYGQNLDMVLVLNAELDAAAKVEIRIIVDDDPSMEIPLVEERSMSGKRIFAGSNPQKVYGEGVHACKVYMTVTDSPILVGDLTL